jgi:hypothetical protein
MHFVHGPIQAGKNLTYMSYTDSIHVLDHFVVSRATNDNINVGAVATADTVVCMPQGSMATIAANVACISLLPVTVILGAANNNGKEIEVRPKVAADTTVDTADTLVVMSKRKKVLNAASLASVVASKKSRITKGKEPPINLCQFPHLCSDKGLYETLHPCNHPWQKMGHRECKNNCPELC